MIYSVALDGPGGAGKSSVAKRIAEKRGIVYVDTGAMYRVIALYMLRRGVDVKDEERVKNRLEEVKVSIEYHDKSQIMYMNGEDVTGDIRTPRVSMAASAVSAYACVRSYLLSAQQDMAKKQSVIMDGRDIGTVVLPDARVKIFLTADSAVRAKRRYDELCRKGRQVDFDTVLKDIERRDERDINRANAPLRQARDAVLVDTSDMTFPRVVDRIMEIIDEKTGEN